MNAKEAGIAILTGAVTGGFAVAFFSILGTKEPIPTIPFYKECTDNTQCTTENLGCSISMVCQDALKRCTYGMVDSDKCPCVEKEKYPCEYSPGVPGRRVCNRKVPTVPNETVWGACEKL
jgi:hypothetical protein